MYTDFQLNEFKFALDKVNEIPHPDGQGLVLVQREDGQFFTISPTGDTWWSNDKGSWQRFYPQGGGWIAYREDSNRTFYILRLGNIPYMK